MSEKKEPEPHAKKTEVWIVDWSDNKRTIFSDYLEASEYRKWTSERQVCVDNGRYEDVLHVLDADFWTRGSNRVREAALKAKEMPNSEVVTIFANLPGAEQNTPSNTWRCHHCGYWWIRPFQIYCKGSEPISCPKCNYPGEGQSLELIKQKYEVAEAHDRDLHKLTEVLTLLRETCKTLEARYEDHETYNKRVCEEYDNLMKLPCERKAEEDEDGESH